MRPRSSDGTQLPTTRMRAAVYRIRRLVSPTDEMIDLTDGSGQDRPWDMTVEEYEEDPTGNRHRVQADQAQRTQHPPGFAATRRGLLLIYPLQKGTGTVCPSWVSLRVSPTPWMTRRSSTW